MFRDYLHLLFNDDDHVWYSDRFRRAVYSSPITIAEQRLRYLAEQAVGDGLFVALNPADGVGYARNLINSRTYRNLLFEFDDPALTVADQLKLVNELGLPYSAATFSGNKSVHFVVSLEEVASSLKEYRRHRKTIAEILSTANPTLDHSTSSPVGYTRLPGGLRTVRGQPTQQRLIELRERVSTAELYDFYWKHRSIEHHIDDEMIPIPVGNRVGRLPRSSLIHLIETWLFQFSQTHDRERTVTQCPACARKGHDLMGQHLYVNGPDYVLHCMRGCPFHEIFHSLSIYAQPSKQTEAHHG